VREGTKVRACKSAMPYCLSAALPGRKDQIRSFCRLFFHYTSFTFLSDTVRDQLYRRGRNDSTTTKGTLSEESANDQKRGTSQGAKYEDNKASRGTQILRVQERRVMSQVPSYPFMSVGVCVSRHRPTRLPPTSIPR
jgi:hypothetical protein